jgi:hypothetical protein
MSGLEEMEHFFQGLIRVFARENRFWDSGWAPSIPPFAVLCRGLFP